MPVWVVSAQTVSIRGQIVDQRDGSPLPFATVRVVSSKEGATSNKDGNYELQIKKGKYTLTASYVGYVTKTIEVEALKNLENINFSLEFSQV
ncbi:MAG: carboxypeptidase-like regulatory domain-containing protein, partial [Chlorobiota bacterium]